MRASGTLTSVTTKTVTDSSQLWTAQALTGRKIKIIDGKAKGQVQDIIGNSATTISIAGKWGVMPDKTSRYIIQ